jgi:hypothetical protein
MLQDIRRYKSGSKFQHGGGGYQKRPKKIQRLLWTAPYWLANLREFVELGVILSQNESRKSGNFYVSTHNLSQIPAAKPNSDSFPGKTFVIKKVEIEKILKIHQGFKSQKYSKICNKCNIVFKISLTPMCLSDSKTFEMSSTCKKVELLLHINIM